MDTQPRTATEYLRGRDEVLEVLYWAEGEGMGPALTTEQLGLFLTIPSPELEKFLEQLAEERVVHWNEEGWRLTATGHELGARSFALEFHGWTGQAHGDCGPGCPCQGDANLEACHAR